MRVSQVSIYRKQSPYAISQRNINNQPHYLSEQPTNDVNFRGGKLEFFFDLAWTGALSAATGFMGAGLGSAYMLNKYVINKKDADDKQ